jgi:hypothetical protein
VNGKRVMLRYRLKPGQRLALVAPAGSAEAVAVVGEGGNVETAAAAGSPGSAADGQG